MTTPLTTDPQNANAGTKRGRAMIRRSLEACGAGRGIVADKHGVIIGGNKTYAEAMKLGLPVVQVETNGQALVVVQRTDLDLATDPKARTLAYFDNRSAQVDLQWDATQIGEDLLHGQPVDVAFFPDELSAILLSPIDPGAVLDLPAIPDPLTTTVPVSESAAGPTFTVAFATVGQHARWGAFLQAVSDACPDAPTPAVALAAYLTTRGIA